MGSSLTGLDETEPSLAAEPSDGVELDLAHLRDLLSLLRDMDVAAFSGAGFQVSFKTGEPFEGRVPLVGRSPGQTLKDEDRSTSSTQVSGFEFARRYENKDGFKHPTLWPGQNGKVLKFNGSLE